MDSDYGTGRLDSTRRQGIDLVLPVSLANLSANEKLQTLTIERQAGLASGTPTLAFIQ
jgi:hypothetical protein